MNFNDQFYTNKFEFFVTGLRKFPSLRELVAETFTESLGIDNDSDQSIFLSYSNSEETFVTTDTDYPNHLGSQSSSSAMSSSSPIPSYSTMPYSSTTPYYQGNMQVQEESDEDIALYNALYAALDPDEELNDFLSGLPKVDKEDKEEVDASLYNSHRSETVVASKMISPPEKTSFGDVFEELQHELSGVEFEPKPKYSLDNKSSFSRDSKTKARKRLLFSDSLEMGQSKKRRL